MKFTVSVIIPVFNAENFVEKAIKSALQQAEVLEVIVVNDGSTDKTLDVITQIQSNESRVKIYHHENQENKGRSASRNLGITKAIGNYVAFLDADDYFLANRFKNDKSIFEADLKTHGVYNAIGAHFYRKSNLEEEKKLKLTTVNQIIKPQELFEDLLFYRKGHFSIDGLTIKRSIFDSCGVFNETLAVSEDTELIYRMALKCHLKTGIINKPVAMRGVHDSNVFNDDNLYEESRLKVLESLFFWSYKNKIQLVKIDHFLNVLWIFKYQQSKNILKNIGYWFWLFFKTPKFLLTKLGVKYFPVVRLRQKLFPFLYKH
ncbi:glycosyltransferase family 2 protein [Algibacter luteus]|uniref:glycosyltransferase family 2 protein n=1 Tax=Algibacter luteus TaxID=1178825 RepID=UPI002592126C|nr:glycosyltransferase family 2 protein [Algibacter luteus]WJJ95995.1 glycosyltransferase family 2 protein [Algibacter luteus]